MPSNLDQAFYRLRNTVSTESALRVLDALYPALAKAEKYNPAAVIQVSDAAVEVIDTAVYSAYSYTADLEFVVDGKRYTEAELMVAIEAAEEKARASTDAWTKVADEAHDTFERLDVETSDDRKNCLHGEADAASKVETRAWVKKSAKWLQVTKLRRELAAGGTLVDCVGRWARRYDNENPDKEAAAAAGLGIITWENGPLRGKSYLCQRATGPSAASRWAAYEVYAFGGVRQDGVAMLTGQNAVHSLRLMPDATEVCRAAGITEAVLTSDASKQEHVRELDHAGAGPVAAFVALLAFASSANTTTT